MCVNSFNVFTHFTAVSFILLAIEMFHRNLLEGQAGDQIGALLRGIKKTSIRRGMVICHPQAIWSRRKIQAQVNTIVITIHCVYSLQYTIIHLYIHVHNTLTCISYST